MLFLVFLQDPANASSSSVASCYTSVDQEEDQRGQSNTSRDSTLCVVEESLCILSRKKPVGKKSRRSAIVQKKEASSTDVSHQSPQYDSDIYSSDDQFDKEDHKESNRCYSCDSDVIQRKISFCRQRRRSTPHLSSSIAEDSVFFTEDCHSPIFPNHRSVERKQSVKQKEADISVSWFDESCLLLYDRWGIFSKPKSFLEHFCKITCLCVCTIALLGVIYKFCRFRTSVRKAAIYQSFSVLLSRIR